MKHIKFIIVAISILCCGAMMAQKAATELSDANITGHVLDGQTGEHLPYITIQIKNSNTGTTTDATGHYMLTNLTPGEVVLVFSMVGYENVEKTVELVQGNTLKLDVTLFEISTKIDEVVVTSNKYATKKRDASTLVSVLPPTLFAKTASCQVSDVLDYQTGLRVENDCSNCGFLQLRINGLPGEYSQILMDSRPIFSSMAAVYGLEQLPLGMVDRIEVIRGGGSALFGANAIGGVVNIITKEPTHNSAQIQNNFLLMGGSSIDNNTSLNASLISSDSKMGVYLFSTLRERQAYDYDGDGFSERPLLKNNLIGFRSFFKPTDYGKLSIEYHHMGEKRRGGSDLDKQPHEALLCESLEHSIHAAGVSYDYYSPSGAHFLSGYFSMQHIDRKSYFGTNMDPNAYGASSDFIGLTGVQYRYHMQNCLFMPANLSAGIEASYNDLKDKILGYNRNLHQQVFVYGGYVQNEWQNEMLTLLIGARLEKHNLIKNAVVSPRVNVRYTPLHWLVTRLSYASGYRAPQAYDEDLHVGAVGGSVSLIKIDPTLRPEFSHSVSGSIDLEHRFGKWNLMSTIEAFFTQLNDVFKLETQGHDDQDNLLLLRTNGSGARVYGLNIDVQADYSKKLTLQAGVTYQQSRYIKPEVWSDNVLLIAQRRMFRTPDFYGYGLVNYEPIKGLKLTFNVKYTGSMLVQHCAGVIAEDAEVVTPDFWDLGCRIGYDVKIFKGYILELNAGMKNILNSYQKDLDTGVNRDAGYIYGPSLPRSVFVGIDLRL